MGKRFSLESISACAELSRRGLGSVGFATNDANRAAAQKLLHSLVWGVFFWTVEALVIASLKSQFSWSKNTLLKAAGKYLST